MVGQTDGRTCRQHYTSASLNWQRYKNSKRSLNVSRSCFYDAERVLSATAKFLVHLLGEGNGGMRMEGEGGSRERERVRRYRRDRIWREWK